MPQKCVVPLCQGNYKNGPKVSVFGFPTNEDLKLKWLKAIPRKDFQPTRNSKVCEVHFREEDFRRVTEHFDETTGKKITVELKKPLLKPNAVPSLFPGCPSYLSSSKSSREKPSSKRERMEHAYLEAAISKSLDSQVEYEKKYCFHSLDELVLALENVKIPEFFTVVKNKEHMCFINFEVEPSPDLVFSVIVDKDLQIKAYFKNVMLTKVSSYELPFKTDNVNTLCSFLDEVMHIKKMESKENHYFQKMLHLTQDVLHELEKIVPQDKQNVLHLILEQLSLLNCHKNNHVYSSDVLILTSLMFSISPHSYNFLRNSGYLTLPHPCTLKRLCSTYGTDPKLEEKEDCFLMYPKQRITFLSEQEKYVTLMVDEIHLKPYLDYKGGNILGVAYNSENAANSAHVFMIQSVASSYKDVVFILPVKKITAEMFHAYIVKVIRGLEGIGFKVISVITDNNAMNRRALSFCASPPKLSIVYQHPFDPSRPLFFVIDSVHILKNIRNNWLNQKTSGQCMYYPEFEAIQQTDASSKLKPASMAALKKLHQAEQESTAKFAHTLTTKALYPNNLERQNVKLVLQIFNLQVSAGLRIAGPTYDIENSETTAEYIDIIIKWWDIVNVKTIFKGTHKRNAFQEPLTMSTNDVKVTFMNKFLDWLERWENYKCDAGCYTKETQMALKHTTYALLEISRYCIEELGFKYILTGKFQTDALEDRFGRYRQLAGAQYNISLTQVYETEKKLRIQSLLPLHLNSHSRGKINIGNVNNARMGFSMSDLDFNVSTADYKIRVDDNDILEASKMDNVLTYIAGYCTHAVLKKINCPFCKRHLVTDELIESNDDSYQLIRNLDRGGLKYPCQEVVNVIIFNYVVISKLLSKEHESVFLKSSNQKEIAIKITTELLSAAERYLSVEICENNHSSDFLLKSFACVSTNIFLKNYCKKQNDTLALAVENRKKRKLQTLMDGK